MRSAERLWNEFLKFCRDQPPDEWLALDFVQFETADLREPMRGRRAAEDLHVLQVLLTWKEKRSRHNETHARCVLSLRLRQTG